ncbi:hypothetical protein [Bacillus sonorensis]|uniref:hypothetical protein n=1 Tax=Bacillus sonorensis TaxID=119858 RepID=UPI0003457BCC|nr:hypothetical protein [Bacillus sonorensis]TWK72806.1 hypothetical protein CHCC20335_1471 [Bacillus paralicheniformis]
MSKSAYAAQVRETVRIQYRCQPGRMGRRFPDRCYCALPDLQLFKDRHTKGHAGCL